MSTPIQLLRRAILLAALSVFAASTPALLAQAAAPIGIPTTVPQAAGQGVAPVQAATSSTTQVPNQSMLYPGEDFQLGPGDLIAVRLFGASEYGETVRLGLDGSVELPYIGNVHLQGLTVRAAQFEVADRLRTQGFYQHPEITIQVLESINGSITISGEIRAVVPVTGARRLIDILSAAGGLPASASHTVRILRPCRGTPPIEPCGDEPIVVNLGTDLTHSADAGMLVYPRDIIQIARAGVVYVLGAFRAQGPQPLDQATPLTLMQLTSLSGGIGYEGKYEDLRLIRTVGNKRSVVEVDIKKVLNGKAPDPVLQANDIVFLPTNQMKAVLKSLGIGGVLGLVSLVYSLHTY